MTRVLLWGVLLAACGGPPGARGPSQPAGMDAGVSPAPPADARPPDRCGGYQLALAPVLGRIELAADDFLEGLRTAENAEDLASSARGFAAALEAERPSLDAIASGDPAIDEAHAGLVAALADLAVVVRAYADAYAGHDQGAVKQATAGLDRAIKGWSAAVERLEQVCPTVK